MKEILRRSFLLLLIPFACPLIASDFIPLKGLFSGKEFNGSKVFNAINAGNLRALKLALNEGASADSYHPEGYTALMLACCKKDTCIVKELIARGANLNLRDDIFERTALHYSAANDFIEAGVLLIRSGANVSLVDDRNFLAREIANDPEEWEKMEIKELEYIEVSIRRALNRASFRSFDEVISLLQEIKISIEESSERMRKENEKILE